MKNKLFVVFNCLSNRYGDVFSSPTDATACRDLSLRLASSPQLVASDYQLCDIGSIDIETGLVESHSPVRVDFKPFSISSAESSLVVDKERSV